MRPRWILGLIAVLASACTAAPTPVTDPEIPRISTDAAPASTDRPVPETCDEILTPDQIGKILGTLLTGDPQPVAGQPLPDIGRTARLDCYYGLQSGQPLSTATVWIGLATYTTPQQAAHRLTNTINDEREAGARADTVPVGSATGTLLIGTTWTLVAQRGRTTAVVTIQPNLIREYHAAAMLGQLADMALTPPP